MARVGLILGVTGQDGSYLARLLLSKGYEVVGISRGNSSGREKCCLERLGISGKVALRKFDARNMCELEKCIRETGPVEIYNLAGESSVAKSFIDPELTLQGNTKITVNCLELIRKYFSSVKYYNAASSECFGETGGVPADETTAFCPVSPYGVAKSADYHLTQVYRRAYGLFCCSGILFNHESPLRAEHFVTKKIISGACAIAQGEKDFIELGNLEVERDWGWAPEYVDAIYRILQHGTADDFVIATGKSNSLRKLVETAFSHFGLNWQEHIRTSSCFLRSGEIQKSLGNPKKALNELGWSATYQVEDVISSMIRDHQDQ
jgi:GDPmannose 4,6-dehydratase